MQKIHRFITSFLSLFLLSFLAGGLSSCKETKVYRIGVSQCSDDDWRTKMNEEINREMIFHDNAIVEIRSADDSNEKQIADIRYFADNGFDIIIAAPNEADALTPIIKEVYEAGIPVLLFDRNIHGDSYTAYQGSDNSAIGRAAGELAGNLATGHCYILEIMGLEGSTPADDRHKGFNEIVDTRPDMTVVGRAHGNWNGPDASVVTDSLLKLYPQTNLIYAHNDRMAIAAAKVANSIGREDIKVIGIDAAPQIGIKAVKEGLIDATFLYPTDGYELIRTAMAILEGRPYERRRMLSAPPIVDASNAEILLLQNDQLKEETAKISWLKERVDDYWTKHSVQSTLLYAAIAIVTLLFILIFAMLRAFWVRKQHQMHLAEQNKALEEQRDRVMALNQQLNEATQSKLMFFTNVSHDLRTPLTLIAGPVEQLANADNLTSTQKTMARLANKNVKILMRLINQILDFRKYENGKLDLNLTEVELAPLLSEWCESFRNIAVSRDINFTTDIPDEGIHTAIDVEKVERVMFNIISNAFKYTRHNGSIGVAMKLVDDRINISVSDTGKGISAEDLSHIFERFFQVDKIHPNGSGIGLSLAKAFIELHGGTITADSIEGKGSVFTVTLPIRHVDSQPQDTQSRITASDVRLELEEVENPPEHIGEDKTTVLVIDDNPDIRSLVSTLLKDDYVVLTAPDGSKGLKLAAKYVPDLIICDVMMPVMDGLECCRRLKNEQSTSHIPVLMLTACSMDEQRIQGYECGADAYLSKPFNAEVLLARCRSLIENRRRIKSLWPAMAADVRNAARDTSALPTVSENGVSDIDSEFYTRFCKIVESEMSNQELSVDGIAGKMGLGRSQFYRKIKALTNYSPVELLRNMRLAKARTLLSTTEKSVSEIAYEVGFTTPAYFGKCYKDRYNETPSEIRERLNR
ncbi:substrate-binding domain-containing protein [uncultured Duncaniella sp.]|uniref:hybrid sensor histidine kinase/response regulator transcription factor n=1 Tax=uncultured Duncaniella sp. TaxID=2768039 RepID=UPI0025CC558C|nr:substrate-binding domain-containing protein [uncultured Duncaniella sp.]